MKILYRYVAVKFWGPFAFGMGIFAVLVFLADLFDHLQYITKSEAGLPVILKYFALIIPFWTLVIVPVAALLAALIVFSEMVKNGEWIAALASGYRPRQLVMPVMSCVALVAGCNFVLQETVSPRLHLKADEIFQRDIRGRKDWQNFSRRDLVINAGNNVFLTIGNFAPEQGRMDRAVMDVHGKGRAISQIDAREGRWDPAAQKWIFYDGAERLFTKDGAVKERAFSSWASNIDIPPDELVIEKVWPEDLTITDILHRLKSLEKIGAPRHRDLVYLHSKIAAPFANIIICLLGLPFAILLRKANKMLHFAAALVIAFIFWWALTIFQAAGEAGMLPPVLAAWLPVFIFGTAGFFAVKKAGI